MAKKIFQSELESVNTLICQIKEEHNDYRESIKLLSIENYLIEYKSLSEKIEEKRKTLSEKEMRKDLTAQPLAFKMNEFKKEIAYQFMRSFSVVPNVFTRATKLEKLPDTIKEVEKQFFAKIKKAQDYFGEFLEGEFHFGIQVTEIYMPHSIQEIKKLTAEKEWSAYTIECGCPQPYYMRRFNDILKEAINAYMEK